jgi:hypothetical protein
MLCKEVMFVYCKNRTKHINALCLKTHEFLTLQEVVNIVVTGL